MPALALTLVITSSVAAPFVDRGDAKGHQVGYVNRIVHSRDGTLFASCSNNEIVLWEAAGPTVRHHLPAPGDYTVNAIAFTPDGKLLAAGRDRTIELYDTKSGKRVRELAIAGEGGVGALAISPDGKLLAASSAGEDGSYAVYGDNVFDLESGKLLVQLQKAKTSQRLCVDMAFSPDGKLLALAYANKEKGIELFDTATWKSKQRIKYKADATRLAFSPGGERLLTGSIDRMLRVHEVPSGKLAKEIVAHVGTKNDDRGYLQGVAMTPDGRRIVTAADDAESVRLWDAGSFEQLGSIGHRVGRTTAMSLAPDGKTVVLGGYAKTLQIIGVEQP